MRLTYFAIGFYIKTTFPCMVCIKGSLSFALAHYFINPLARQFSGVISDTQVHIYICTMVLGRDKRRSCTEPFLLFSMLPLFLFHPRINFDSFK